MRIILDIVVTALALWVVAWLVPGVRIADPTGTYADAWVFLGVAVVFLIVNAIVTPVMRVLGLPITCLTLGLFALVINALAFMLTGWISNQVGLGMHIDGFWPALWGSIVLGAVRGLLSVITPRSS